MTDGPDEAYVTAQEAADRLGLAKDEVELWCETAGRRHGVWFLSGAFLIPPAGLAELRRWWTHKEQRR
jgi:hypothetical protein